MGGEVVVELVTNRVERVQPGAVLVSEHGELRVRRSRQLPATRRHRQAGFPERYLVAFAGVTSRQMAEALRGSVLRAPPLDEPGALWVHELVGSAVVDTQGTVLGTVVAVVANPASDLLELDAGALVPLRFVVSAQPGRVVVEIPEGLLA